MVKLLVMLIFARDTVEHMAKPRGVYDYFSIENFKYCKDKHKSLFLLNKATNITKYIINVTSLLLLFSLVINLIVMLVVGVNSDSTEIESIYFEMRLKNICAYIGIAIIGLFISISLDSYNKTLRDRCIQTLKEEYTIDLLSNFQLLDSAKVRQFGYVFINRSLDRFFENLLYYDENSLKQLLGLLGFPVMLLLINLIDVSVNYLLIKVENKFIDSLSSEEQKKQINFLRDFSVTIGHDKGFVNYCIYHLSRRVGFSYSAGLIIFFSIAVPTLILLQISKKTDNLELKNAMLQKALFFQEDNVIYEEMEKNNLLNIDVLQHVFNIFIVFYLFFYGLFINQLQYYGINRLHSTFMVNSLFSDDAKRIVGGSNSTLKQVEYNTLGNSAVKLRFAVEGKQSEFNPEIVRAMMYYLNQQYHIESPKSKFFSDKDFKDIYNLDSNEGLKKELLHSAKDLSAIYKLPELVEGNLSEGGGEPIESEKFHLILTQLVNEYKGREDKLPPMIKLLYLCAIIERNLSVVFKIEKNAGSLQFNYKKGPPILKETAKILESFYQANYDMEDYIDRAELHAFTITNCLNNKSLNHFLNNRLNFIATNRTEAYLIENFKYLRWSLDRGYINQREIEKKLTNLSNGFKSIINFEKDKLYNLPICTPIKQFFQKDLLISQSADKVIKFTHFKELLDEPINNYLNIYNLMHNELHSAIGETVNLCLKCLKKGCNISSHKKETFFSDDFCKICSNPKDLEIHRDIALFKNGKVIKRGLSHHLLAIENMLYNLLSNKKISLFSLLKESMLGYSAKQNASEDLLSISNEKNIFSLMTEGYVSAFLTISIILGLIVLQEKTGWFTIVSDLYYLYLRKAQVVFLTQYFKRLEFYYEEDKVDLEGSLVGYIYNIDKFTYSVDYLQIKEKYKVEFYDMPVPVLSNANDITIVGGFTTLTGPSGSGKSTLIDKSNGNIVTKEKGEVLLITENKNHEFDIKDIHEVKRSSIKNSMVSIAQFVNFTKGYSIADVCELVIKPEQKHILFDLLMQFNMNFLYNKFNDGIDESKLQSILWNQMSGGQKRRMAICLMLTVFIVGKFKHDSKDRFNNPISLLVIDEMMGLDTNNRKVMYRLIKEGLYHMVNKYRYEPIIKWNEDTFPQYKSLWESIKDNSFTFMLTSHFNEEQAVDVNLRFHFGSIKEIYHTNRNKELSEYIYKHLKK